MNLPPLLSLTILDSMHTEIFVYNRKGEFVFINKSAIFEDKLRNDFYLKTEWELCDWFRYSSDIAENRIQLIEQVFQTGERFQREEIILYFGSKKVYYLQTFIPIYNEDGNIEYVTRYAADISDRVLVQKEFEYLAHHDPLTGLPNRRLFYQKLEYYYNSSGMNAVILLDLDRFKVINDTLGHIAGDTLIRAVAGRLLQITQKEQNTVLSRLGGDEFAIYMFQMKNSRVIEDFVIKVVQAFQEPFDLKGHQLFITTSIGVYSFINLEENENPDSMIHKADIAMYHAKEAGRNQYFLYSKGMENKTENVFSIETKIFKGLQLKEFSLDFQPKVDVIKQKVIGAEALLRWNNHKNLDIKELIEIAEGKKLINLLGYFVVEEAIKFLSRIQNLGHEKFTVAINLSESQFVDERLIPKITEIAQNERVSLDCLELEIKENIVMKNVTKSVEQINKLRSLGLRITIDDYGSGSSSLSYLRNCPIDVINIDRSFIANIVGNYQDAAITGAIVSMAQKLKIKVSAEGVETKDQLLFLKYIRCDYMQGYIFGRPMDAESFEAFINSTPNYTDLFSENESE